MVSCRMKLMKNWMVHNILKFNVKHQNMEKWMANRAFSKNLEYCFIIVKYEKLLYI